MNWDDEKEFVDQMNYIMTGRQLDDTILCIVWISRQIEDIQNSIKRKESLLRDFEDLRENEKNNLNLTVCANIQDLKSEIDSLSENFYRLNVIKKFLIEAKWDYEDNWCVTDGEKV